MSILMNVRIPKDLKDHFQDVCRQNHTYMTTEIIRFMKEFVSRRIHNQRPHQTRSNHSDQHTSDDFVPEMWGHVVQDPVTKIWMTKEEYHSHVK